MLPRRRHFDEISEKRFCISAGGSDGAGGVGARTTGRDDDGELREVLADNSLGRPRVGVELN